MAQKRPHPAALGLHVPAYTLTCVACNYAAQSYDAYIGHLISCPDLPQVRCSHCSTTFRDAEELALHLGEPPLLSFLFDPPTTSSTTAVTTTAATVFTTTLSLLHILPCRHIFSIPQPHLLQHRKSPPFHHLYFPPLLPTTRILTLFPNACPILHPSHHLRFPPPM